MRKSNTYKMPLLVLLFMAIEVLFWSGMIGLYYLVSQFDPSLALHNRPWLWTLLLLPMSMIIFLINLAWKNRALRRLADGHLLSNMAPRMSPTRTIFKFIIWRLVLGMIIIALLDPKVGSKIEEVETQGIDLMVAIDVSNSMLAEDLKPNRLKLAKRSVQQVVNDMGSNRLGIVIFAGDAYVQLPLTSDTKAAKIFLDAIETNSVPTQGTAIGAALDLCINSFDQDSEAGKAILLITDGENHEDDAIASAELAASRGIQICAIGAGLPGGAPIPEFDRNGRRNGFKTDPNGKTVVTQLNEQMLVDLVKIGDGTFVRANEQIVDVRPILDAFKELELGDLGTANFVDYEHRFRLFAIAALLLLVTETLLSERAWKHKFTIS
ncbi:MAG: VWA domain-containing protein [Flavobacteriales bacterium]|nr:VWA domain-containing protein [Flavobacteriales bacterium]